MKLLREYAREIMTSQVDPGNVDLYICAKKISVELATTNETRNRGLMYRHSLGADDGMLFVFPNLDYHSFWMKNTLIPLDIIWLDSNWRVTDIYMNAPPCTRIPCPVYRPLQKAQYVLELPAFSTNRYSIAIGNNARIRMRNSQ